MGNWRIQLIFGKTWNQLHPSLVYWLVVNWGKEHTYSSGMIGGYKDHWEKDIRYRYCMTITHKLRICQYIWQINGACNWNFGLENHVSEEVQVEEQMLWLELRKYNILSDEQEDEICWKWNKEGKFCVKSFYRVIVARRAIYTSGHI